MTRHSRNCTAGAFYSYAERKRDSEQSGFGSANKRLNKDSVGDFDCCNLSLQICKNPVVTPEGIVYEREAILNYMVEQKSKIEATKKRKMKEEREKEEPVPAKVFKGQSSADVAMSRFGSKVNNFWDPAATVGTQDDKTAYKHKNVEKVRDPVTNRVLKLKNLVSVKFTAIDTTLSDVKRQAAKSRWKDPISGDVLTNKIQCFVVKPTGDVITQKTKEVIAKDMIFPIGDIKLDESDFIALKRGGTGFASANDDLKAKLYRPVMQC